MIKFFFSLTMLIPLSRVYDYMSHKNQCYSTCWTHTCSHTHTGHKRAHILTYTPLIVLCPILFSIRASIYWISYTETPWEGRSKAQPESPYTPLLSRLLSNLDL